MEFEKVVNEMMDFYATGLKSSYDGCLHANQQMLSLANALLPGMIGVNEKQSKVFLDGWKKAFGGAFGVLQSFHCELFNAMKSEKIFKQTIEDAWRQVGLASLAETNMLQNQLEKAFSTITAVSGSVADMEALRMTVTQMKSDLGQYLDEISHVKQMVAQITPKISALKTAIDKLQDATIKALPNPDK